ncbi:MAG: protein kinase [Myxococcota bacterium]
MQERLGRYILVEHLATGGMGEIWLALDPQEGRVVAIKRLRPELGNTADVREMFDDEARLSARLHHPNIVEVYSFEIIEKDRLIVMEYVVGVSTKALMDAVESRGIRLPLGAALSIVAEACAALHYAHELTDEQGRPMRLVHRDITPHNLLVRFEGSLKVVDFGIAKSSARVHQTQHGMIKGKTSYMSPEQCTGLDLDRRSDIFTLGIVLFELVTGRRLFLRSSDIDNLMAIISDPIPRPSELEPSVSPNLEAIILKALDREPRGRWKTAEAMGRALRDELSTLGLDGRRDLRRTVATLFDPEIRAAGAQLNRAASQVTPPQGNRLLEATRAITAQLDAVASETDPSMLTVPRIVGQPMPAVEDRTPPPRMEALPPLTPPSPLQSFVPSVSYVPDSRPAVWLLAGSALLLVATMVLVALAPAPAERAKARGTKYLLAGELAQAEDEFLRCVDAEPREADCHRDLGAVLVAEGRTKDAIISYRNYLSVAPQGPSAPEVRRALASLETTTSSAAATP